MPSDTQQKSVQGLRLAQGVVKPEWIDENGHMNVAWYVLAFDLAVDVLWEKIGITPDYRAKTQGSTFAVESHVTYQQELLQGDEYFVTLQILAYDEKRIHQFQRLYHAQQGFLAATGEWMNLHVNLQARRVQPWPESILSNLAKLAAEQSISDYPNVAGKKISIEEPAYSLYPER